MSLGHISDSDVSELRRSVSGCGESGVEICTAAVRVIQPKVLAARERGDDLQAASRICFEIDFCPYFFHVDLSLPFHLLGGGMQNFTLE